MTHNNPTIFGIRHHGPGSARSLREALVALQPDCILVEGPPEGDALLPLVAHEAMEPPVSLLLYAPDEPSLAVHYPFALYSPEWQAIRFGLSQGVPVRFMDLPQSHSLALAKQQMAQVAAQPATPPDEGATSEAEAERAELSLDPLSWLARASGYSDGERWWEHMVEQRRDSTDLFAAIIEAMAALRDSLPAGPDPIEEAREAYMRKTIRQAIKEGFERIAVVCGAWHSPALLPARWPSRREDDARLKGLPKLKLQATWVPWSYGRLLASNGYGAGVESPGWYHHLWGTETELIPRWMTHVAHLLRAEGLDASSAHIIEAVRLAETLAALRDRPLPGLPEVTEATRAIFCFDDDLPMRLIHQRLIVGERLGAVPDETPMVPLQQELIRLQKQLRLKPQATATDLALDLRKELDLARSHLLHRLALLEVPWGKKQRGPHGARGTFHETWRLHWAPEYALHLIEAGMWGNTLESAASALVAHRAAQAETLPPLTALVEQTLLADLPQAVGPLMARVQAEAARASDIGHLMEALPPLVQVQRYGSVRQTDAALVRPVTEGLVTRLCIGLPGACASLDNDAAEEMVKRLMGVQGAIALLEEAQRADWQAALRRLAEQQGLHGLVAGRCVRLLLDAGEWDNTEAGRRLGLALSNAVDPAQAAAWIEGFLHGSGLLLLHDETLWQLLDEWLCALPADRFRAVVPLLRRTFAAFPAAERRQMGERVRRGTLTHNPLLRRHAGELDHEQAAAVLPLVAQLLGVTP